MGTTGSAEAAGAAGTAGSPALPSRTGEAPETPARAWEPRTRAGGLPARPPIWDLPADGPPEPAAEPGHTGRASGGRELLLRDLLAGLEGDPFGDWAGVLVRGIEADSRKVRPGDLFVGLDGQQSRGAWFVREAARQGAVAAVIPAGRAPAGAPAGTPPLPGLRVADTRHALAILSARFYGEPARSVRVFGVTGTNGKSTVTHMLAQILEKAGRPAAVWSTPIVDSGVRRFRPKLTTPEPHQLHRFLREALEAGRRDACIEVSSHAVVLKRLAGVPFAGGIVTNISPDHLEFHGSFESYAAAKRAFVEALAEGVPCLLNADDPCVREFGRGTRARVLLYGFAEEAGLRAVDPVFRPEGTRFQVRWTEAAADACGVPAAARFAEVEIPVPGRHNAHNALAALGLCLLAGVPLEAAREALRCFTPPARRLGRIELGGITIIDDVAMNEASYEAVLRTMEELRCPRLVVVNALRGNRGPQVNAGIARVLARWNRRLGFAPLVASLSRSHVEKYELDYRVRPEELEAFVAAAREEGMPVSVHDELPGAIAEGLDRLAGEGTLLLLGTFGMDDGVAIAWEALQRRS